ncbi:hypothetical protein [Parasedimentitalea psychrophila]|uniref:Uncharacterized protein n=1 Tax=Parasedimentitalea psychrophila TaxID=2997337 RepID=A0A9Y2L2V9_9RHOB|nr:hypothetical protein [Parasedimentitalea psychrophila]WIY27701.1 hypothetical protein QPJ95_02095 [Parasedimentitalea psychrophila]
MMIIAGETKPAPDAAMIRALHNAHLWTADLRKRCCQVHSNGSQQGQHDCSLCRTKLAPLGEIGGVVALEIGA